MSATHIPSHRKPRTRSPRQLALRAGVAGGVLSTIAVTSGAAPSSATGKDDAEPTATTAQLPTLTANLPAEAAQTAQSLHTTASQYERQLARETAAAEAAKHAEEKKAKAEARAEAQAQAEAEAEAAAREAAAEKAAAQDRASRSAERTELNIPEASGSVGELISFLRAQVGKAYVMGATGPSAYDCSGLVQVAFRQVGVELPRVSQDQSVAGTPVAPGNYQVGDILYWGGAGSAYHVAVYIGGGQYIDAANPEKGVVIQDVNDWPPDGATRVL